MASGLAASGESHCQFAVFEHGDGGRHGVRVMSSVAASDLDQCRDATVLQSPGERAVVVRMPLGAALDWLMDTLAPRHGVRHVLADALRLGPR